MNELEYEALAVPDAIYQPARIRCRRTGARAWTLEAETGYWRNVTVRTRREAAMFLDVTIRKARILGQVHVETVTPKMRAALSAS